MCEEHLNNKTKEWNLVKLGFTISSVFKVKERKKERKKDRKKKRKKDFVRYFAVQEFDGMGRTTEEEMNKWLELK